jgi:hypothetical protein
MGGVACLLILFPKLLIENEKAAYFLGPKKNNNSKNNCDGDGNLNDSDKNESEYTDIQISTPTDTLLDESLFGVLESEYSEAPDSGCVGLLLSIVAHCLAYHKTYQRYIILYIVSMCIYVYIYIYIYIYIYVYIVIATVHMYV